MVEGPHTLHSSWQLQCRSIEQWTTIELIVTAGQSVGCQCFISWAIGPSLENRDHGIAGMLACQCCESITAGPWWRDTPLSTPSPRRYQRGYPFQCNEGQLTGGRHWPLSLLLSAECWLQCKRMMLAVSVRRDWFGWRLSSLNFEVKKFWNL